MGARTCAGASAAMRAVTPYGSCRATGVSWPRMLDRPIASGSANAQKSWVTVAGSHTARVPTWRSCGHGDVDERCLGPVAHPRLEQLGAGYHAVGRYRAGGDQPRRQAGDRRLPDRWKRVVGPRGQGQHGHVARCRRGDPGGAVTAETNDHTRARGHHPPDGVHRVLRGLPDRLAIEKLHLRPVNVLAAAPLDRTEHRCGNAAEVGAEQDAVHANGIERGQHALDHVRFLRRREHRGLRHQAPDVATGQRVRHNANDRIPQSPTSLALLCASAGETGTLTGID